MIAIKIDNDGSYIVRWPSRPQDILQLGAAYVAYEASLPTHKQILTPSLALVQAAVASAQAEQASAGSGEAARAIAAETYRQTIAVVKTKLNQALLQLKAKYAVNQAQLENWGLDTVSSVNGISVRKPRYDKEWAAFLDAYVTQETSLDAAARLLDPPLAEMTTLNNILKAADAARQAGRNQRESAVQTRSVLADELLDLLQLAALAIVVTQEGRTVTSKLQSWGYEVVQRTASPAPKSEPTP